MKALKLTPLMYMFGAMTLASFGGPALIGVILWGGASPDWPPDRPIEWITVIGTGLVVFGLMVGIVVVGLSEKRKNASMPAQRPSETRSGS